MRKIKSLIKYCFLTFLIAVLTLTIFTLLRTPPTNKNWNTEGQILPEINMGTSSVEIKNIKNFSYGKTDKEYTANYYNKTYPLDEVQNIYFKVNPFWGHQIAHTYLTFEFENGDLLSVSVEARKEKGESYNPIYGLCGAYNIFYMFVNDNDITTLRSVVRDDKLYSYKLKLTAEQKNNLWKEVLQRGAETSKEPEFYNTLFSSCTTNVFDSLNEVLSENEKIDFDWRILLPENSAEIFYNNKMLEIDYGQFSTYESLKNFSEI